MKKILKNFKWIFLFIIFSIKGLNCIKLISIVIPKFAKIGQDVRLVCKYSLENDMLYSLKWHFNNKEFYRYVPRDVPKLLTFPIKGLKIDSQKSFNGTVTLKQVSYEASGQYKCEISAEMPFQTIAREKIMTVVANFSSSNFLTKPKLSHFFLLISYLILLQLFQNEFT